MATFIVRYTIFRRSYGKVVHYMKIIADVEYIRRIVFFSVPWCPKHSSGKSKGHVNYRPRAINRFLDGLAVQLAEIPGALTKVKFFDYSRMFTAQDGRQRRAVRSYFASYLGNNLDNVDLLHLTDESNRDLLKQFRLFCLHEYGWPDDLSPIA